MFIFNESATTEIYTLSLHDALPICWAPLLLSLRVAALATVLAGLLGVSFAALVAVARIPGRDLVDALITAPMVLPPTDRKSTRLNSSYANISYAVFCLK